MAEKKERFVVNISICNDGINYTDRLRSMLIALNDNHAFVHKTIGVDDRVIYTVGCNYSERLLRFIAAVCALYKVEYIYYDFKEYQ